ncbi:MAG: efflux RND transporter periplasmic adaptor subunit [Chthoniobacteraceae bacterium]
MNLSLSRNARGRAQLTALLIIIVAGAAALGGWYFGRQLPRAAEVAARKVLFYQSPMHPWIKSDQPGNCTICGMKLVPVYEGEKSFDETGSTTPTPTLSEQAANVIHVETSPVVRQPLHRAIRVAGTIEDDDSTHRILSAYVDGRIDKLHVNFIGAEVTAGQPLADFFSRDLIVARSEYTLATRMPAGVQRELAINGSREKLRRMGLTLEQIDKLAGQTGDTIPIVAPASGTVVARKVYEGQYVKEGDVLFEIADFSRMWFVFDAYERDLTWFKVGQKVEITSSSIPGKKILAPVAFIDPNLNPMTRSARIRVVLDNPSSADPGKHRHELLHKVYAEGRIVVATEPVLAVPRSAVLSAGSGPLVYVERQVGEYEARRVLLGRAGDDVSEVLSGLREGERVVTTGNLFIDSQMQLDQGGSAPSEVAAVVPAFSDTQRAAARKFIAAAAQSGVPLAADDLAGYNKQVAALHSASMELAGLLGVRADRVEKAAHIGEAAGLPEARKAYYPLSMIAAELAAELRKQSPDFADVRIYECPMVNSAVPSAETAAGRWVQFAAPLRNPFFGAEMLECGQEVKP